MIRNIWAVGRNYAEHAKELGNEVPTEPLIFLKAGSCASTEREIVLPDFAAGDLHHELEIAYEFAADLSFRSMSLALDLTDREAQNKLKAKGSPWTLAKSFKGACPLSASVPFTPGALTLELKINGQTRQKGSTEQMIFSPDVLRKYVLKRYPVHAGDLLLTGTPAGVGPLRAGDELVATLCDGDEHRLIRAQWVVVGGAGAQ